MISKETREKIIDDDYAGKTKEDNARSNNVSPTTVLNVVKEYEREIGKGERTSYRRVAKYVDKHNLSYEQIHHGIKTNSILKKYNLDDENIDKLFSHFSKLQNVQNLPKLLENADLLTTIAEKTGKSYDKIVEEYQEKTEEIPKLVQLESSKRKNIETLEVQYQDILKRNNLNEEKISQYNHSKANLAKYGISIEDSPQLAARVFHESELLGYDPRKLVKILQEDDSLNDHTKKVRYEIQRLEEYLNRLKKQVKEEQEALTFAKSFLSSYMQDIKRVIDIQKMGYKTEDFVKVAKIIHKNGFTIDEFVKILDSFEDISSFIDSIVATKDSLEEQIDSLSSKAGSLKQEKESLEEIKKELETSVLPKIAKIKEERTLLYATAPLMAIYSNSGDPMKVIPINIAYQNTLKGWSKTHLPGSDQIVDTIEELVKLFDKAMTGVAA